MTTPYLKGAANTHVAFLQKHSTLNLQWWKLRLKHHTCYVLHYFKFSPLLADILADIFLNIVSDISSQTFFLNFLQTYFLTFFLTYLVTSCNYFFDTLFLQLLPILSIAVEVRHATLNSHDRGWGPARHTELAGSQLRSGTPHSTHGLAVGVRHATLNSRARGWGPARHTELTSSQVEVRHATLNSRARSWGPTRHTELTSSQLRSDKETDEEAEEDAEEEEEKRLT